MFLQTGAEIGIWQKVAEHGIPLLLACIAIAFLWRALEAERKAHVANLLRLAHGEDDNDTKPK